MTKHGNRRLEDCGQNGVCALSPGCVRHFLERNRELVDECDRLRSELDEATRLLHLLDDQEARHPDVAEFLDKERG